MSELSSGTVETGHMDFIEQPSVVVQKVSKSYRITSSGSRHATQKDVRKSGKFVHALKDASLVVMPGQSVGIIGLNGSGKSTLLSLIAGAQVPTAGTIMVRSQPTLMGVSPALQSGLTGERNILLGCLALGMSPDEATKQVPVIAKWTELGDAIHRPMATYSSGMKARLAFAISTAVDPDVLMIDEALSTGDAAFGQKAEARMRDLLGKAGTLFLVSHSIGQIEKNCERVIWINKGEIIADGLTEVIGPQYHEWARLMGKDDKAPAHEYLEGIIDAYVAPLVLFDGEV